MAAALCVNRVYIPLLYSLLIPLQDLTKQLDEVTQNSEIVEIRQKEAECELEASRDRVQQQATEILLKASKTLLLSHMDWYSLCWFILAPTLPTRLFQVSCKHIKHIH